MKSWLTWNSPWRSGWMKTHRIWFTTTLSLGLFVFWGMYFTYCINLKRKLQSPLWPLASNTLWPGFPAHFAQRPILSSNWYLQFLSGSSAAPERKLMPALGSRRIIEVVYVECGFLDLSRHHMKQKSMLYTTLRLSSKRMFPNCSGNEKRCLLHKLLVFNGQTGNYPSISIDLPLRCILHNWSPTLRKIKKKKSGLF